MKKWLKALNIVVIIALIKTVQSCIFFMDCECSDEIFHYSINSVEITNIDNSQTYPISTDENVMHRAAVAFNVRISDTTHAEYYACKQPLKIVVGFSTAQAWSCDCPMNYLPDATIQSFKIHTVFDINDTIKAGADVSKLFLAMNRFNYSDDLYHEVNDMVNKVNITTNDSPDISFKMFLKVPVDNNQAEFTIDITLSNGAQISKSTNTISII